MQQKHNYLLWTSSFQPRIGGVENAAKEYALFMKEIGWNVTVITNRYPKNLPKNDNLEGLSIKRLFFFHSSCLNF